MLTVRTVFFSLFAKSHFNRFRFFLLHPGWFNIKVVFGFQNLRLCFAALRRKLLLDRHAILQEGSVHHPSPGMYPSQVLQDMHLALLIYFNSRA